MKIILTGVLVNIFMVFTYLYGQDQCAPVGWAAQNGNTTGGGNASPITVCTIGDLQTQASSSGAKVIYVSGVMGAGVGTRVSVSSNKTIFGLPGARLNGGFDVKNASNVIIRNMIVRGPGAIDVDGVDCMTIDNSTNVWIDHCDISDGQDGNMDIVNGSNYVSVTWTKFNYTSASVEHKFCNLIGNSDSKTSDRGKLKVTMMFNWWGADCVERMPRVRFGQVHVVNNYFDSPSANHCVRAGIEADILVESNMFRGVSKPIDLYQNNFTGVTARNNSFIGTNGNTAGSGTSFIPPYSLSIITPAAAEPIIKSCAGATLTSPSVCPCNNGLAVGILDFTVRKKTTDYLQLNWLLTDTKEVTNVAIEYSEDGTHFRELVLLHPDINQYGLNDYSILNKPVVYFRLKVIENYTTFTYSDIKAVSIENQLFVYPNPFMNVLNLEGKIEEGNIKIFSIEGKEVLHFDVDESIQTLDLSILPNGTYVLVIVDHVHNIVFRKTIIKL